MALMRAGPFAEVQRFPRSGEKGQTGRASTQYRDGRPAVLGEMAPQSGELKRCRRLAPEPHRTRAVPDLVSCHAASRAYSSATCRDEQARSARTGGAQRCHSLWPAAGYSVSREVDTRAPAANSAQDFGARSRPRSREPQHELMDSVRDHDMALELRHGRAVHELAKPRCSRCGRADPRTIPARAR